MKKFSLKILLPLLCVAALTVGTVGALAVSGAETAPAAEARSIYDILERDGYIEGCWYPWLTHTYLGSSLAKNPDMEDRDSYGSTDYWQPFNKIGIDEYGEAKIKQEIFNLKALGFNVMAYMGSPWGEGLVHDQTTADVVGVREEYLVNMRRLLDICREVGMPVVWYIHCHSSAVPNYIGRDAWNFICQMYSNPEITKNYCDKFVRPVCQVLNEYRDVVVMVGITDELENEINDSQLGDKFDNGSRETYGVTQDDAVNYFVSIGQTVKEEMPGIATTLASNKDDFAMYADANIDMVGRNQYSSSANAKSLYNTYPVGPMLATEFGMGDGTWTQSEAEWSSRMLTFRDRLMGYGYSGWFQWAWQPTLGGGSAGGNQYLKSAAATVYDFREGMYDLYYYVEEYRNQYDSATHTVGKPSVFYHDGLGSNGKVYWIQPKGATAYQVERSVDGGKTWTAVNATAAVDTDTGSHRYCVTDPSPRTSGTVQYRVTVNGKTSYSNEWVY